MRSEYHTIRTAEWERGKQYMDRSIKLNPFHPKFFHAPYFVYYYMNGEYELALDVAYKYDRPHFWTLLLRAATLGQLGRHDEASAECDALLKLLPDFVERREFYVDSHGLHNDIVEALIDGLNSGQWSVVSIQYSGITES
jgi:hypothetical protein